LRAEAIFGPVGMLALWTMAVLLLIGFRRLTATRAGRVPVNAFRLGESPEVPDDVALPNRNLINLLEVPLLFYVVCLALYVTHQVQLGCLRLAWIYVGLRVVHSLIHLTTNNVRQRLMVFALSNFALVTLWIWFLRRVI
jgi:hypothetical protein